MAILDMIIIKGSEVLHNIALAVLYLIKDYLLSCSDICKCPGLYSFRGDFWDTWEPPHLH